MFYPPRQWICFRPILISWSCCCFIVRVAGTSTASTELLEFVQAKQDQYLKDDDSLQLPRLAETIELRPIKKRRGRGVFARKQLKAGRTIAKLPPQSLIHAGLFMRRPMPLLIEHGLVHRNEPEPVRSEIALKLVLASQRSHVSLDSLSDATWASLFLLEQLKLGRESPWEKYVSLLPKTFGGMPWSSGLSEEMLAQMENSSFANCHQDYLRGIEKQYELVNDLVPDMSSQFKFIQFLWGVETVNSRSFVVDIKGIKSQSAVLAPLVDLMSHCRNASVSYDWNTLTVTLDVFVTRDVNVGDELCITYGTKSNAQIMRSFGFTDTGNSLVKSSATVQLEVDETIPAEDYGLIRRTDVHIEDALGRMIVDGVFAVCPHVDVRVNLECAGQLMIAHARFMEASAQGSLSKWLGKGLCFKHTESAPSRCAKPLSPENEIAALQRCASAVEKAIDRYEGKSIVGISEDEHHLSTILQEEQLVLSWWRRFLRLALAVLRGDVEIDRALDRSAVIEQWRSRFYESNLSKAFLHRGNDYKDFVSDDSALSYVLNLVRATVVDVARTKRTEL